MVIGSSDRLGDRTARPQAGQGPVEPEDPSTARHRAQTPRDLLSRWLWPDGPAPFGLDPAVRDADHVAAVKRRLDRVFGPGRYLRVRVDGWSHLPASPAFMVSNHSGGSTVMDVMAFGWAWVDRFGLDRPLYGLSHDLLFSNRLTGPFFERMGALRARPRAAASVLQGAQRDLVVYPGGDQDTWRPWSERYQVHFAGRTGYARQALTLGIPVTPLAHAGAQESLLIVGKGRRLARAVGLHRVARAEIWPVHLSAPWGLTLGPLPHLPLPVRLDFRFGPPVPFPAGFRPGMRVTESVVRTYDAQVRTAMQVLLDALKVQRAGFVRRMLARLADRVLPAADRPDAPLTGR